MPKVSPEHIEERKAEIINACERIYREKGFYGVTIKEISTATSFTRPAIYTYYETKDEILLALLIREYEKWCGALGRITKSKDPLSRSQIAEKVARTLKDRIILLRIQNMNLFEIELNSRVERLAEFKVIYGKTSQLMADIVRTYRPDATDAECDSFSILFFSFLFGIYPFVYHTDKQIEAMQLARIKAVDTSVYEMVHSCLLRILPNENHTEGES